MTWHQFLIEERMDILSRIEVLSSGKVQLHMTTDGVSRDITEEQVERLEANLVEIEAILKKAGFVH